MFNGMMWSLRCRPIHQSIHWQEVPHSPPPGAQDDTTVRGSLESRFVRLTHALSAKASRFTGPFTAQCDDGSTVMNPRSPDDCDTEHRGAAAATA